MIAEKKKLWIPVYSAGVIIFIYLIFHYINNTTSPPSAIEQPNWFHTNQHYIVGVLLSLCVIVEIILLAWPSKKTSNKKVISGSMDPDVLTVYKSPFNKVRIGQNNDGGYIIVEIPNISYTTLIAGGICDDISFEEQFMDKYPDVQVFAFDGTIDQLPKENNKISFIKKNIGHENDDHLTNLHDIIDVNERIFVKIDIEGGEIPWIHSLSDDQLNKFEQIVMEFHHPYSEKEIDVFNKINKNHYLVHFHANNCCGVRNHRGIIIPNIFECTYLHKKYFKTVELNEEAIPGNLDMKNVIDHDEIYINYPPFVHPSSCV